MRGRLEPLRVPGYRPLAGSYAINRIGDVLALVALAVVVYDQTGSPWATTGMFLAMEFVPSLLAPALTARFDRLPIGRVLFVIYLVEAVTFGVLAWLTHSFSLPVVLVLLAIDGNLSVLARALTRGAMVGVLEPAGLLREGNALLNLVLAPAFAFGGALAGVVIVAFGADVALIVDAVSFFGAALIASRAGRGVAAGAEDAEDDDEHWRERLRAALGYLRRHRYAQVLLAAQGVATIFFTLTIPIEVVYATQSLDAGNGGYGAFFACWGGGVVLGSVAYAALQRVPTAAIALGATLLQGASFLGLAVAPEIVSACFIAVAGGVANGLEETALITALQEAVSSRYQTRVMAVLESATTATPSIGFLLGGGLAAAFSARTAFAVAGAGCFVVVLAVLVARPWRLPHGTAADPLPAAPPS